MLLAGGLLLALLIAYSNHFENGFHFDDAHAVVENGAIRTLANVPRFFRDARTFSNNPAGQSYRPLVSASLALDYALGGGLRPFWFQLSTFVWFIVQLVLMYALYLHVLERADPGPRNALVAWFAVALYGLHPASAETVNYIVQRGDLFVALGIVAGIVIYAASPARRRFGLYLLPPLAAMFAKPVALIFPLFLLAYILLVDRFPPLPSGAAHIVKPGPDLRTPGAGRKKGARRQVRKPEMPPATAGQPVATPAARLLYAVPAVVVSAAFLLFERAMTPPTFFQTTIGAFSYWITQPWVTLRYFRSFFLPFWLNIDTDLHAFGSLWNAAALAGFLFCALLLWAAVWTARRREWLPVSFGLWWFFIGLVPTALFPLNEVENDHRMFLPFIGMSLAVAWTAERLARRYAIASGRGIAVAGVVLLAALAWGTHARNEVWRTDETLWRDDIVKSPNNPRGHDQFGAALAQYPDRLPEAIAQYETALRIEPHFANAHLNLGKALARIPGHTADAVREFRTALRQQPDFADAHVNLCAALTGIPGGLPEAIEECRTAVRIAPDFVEAHYNLGVALFQLPGKLPEAISAYESALQLRPDYAEAHYDLGVALARVPGRMPEAMAQYEEALRIEPDYAAAHNALGIALAQMPGRLPDAIREFQAALRAAPDLADARMNLGAALTKSPGRLQDALAECQAALRLAPDSAGAHYNLGVALSQIPGRMPDAISEYEAALRLKPDYAEAHYNLGSALAKIPGRLGDAIGHYEAAVKSNADYADAHSALGIALAGIPGRLPEAISEFRAAARLQPDSATAHSNLALALARAPGQVPEAISEFQASLRIRPDPGIQKTLDGLRSHQRN